MKSISLSKLSILALLILLLAGCNLPTTGAPTPDPGLVYTQAAQTSTALPTNIAPTIPPTISNTQVPPTPTVGISPTTTVYGIANSHPNLHCHAGWDCVY